MTLETPIKNAVDDILIFFSFSEINSKKKKKKKIENL